MLAGGGVMKGRTYRGGKPDSGRPGDDTIDVATLLMHHLPAMTLQDGAGRKILLRSDYLSSGKLRTPGAMIKGWRWDNPLGRPAARCRQEQAWRSDMQFQAELFATVRMVISEA